MIKISNVNKYFNRHKKNEIHVINNTSLTLEGSGLVALLGPSGCGKTTLLNAIGGLDKVNKGDIYVDNERITRKSVGKIDKVRSLKIGYIFQDYNLLNNLSVFDNVAIVLKMNGIKDKNEIKRRVEYCLTKVGMYRYKNRYASMLSGGERQRVGIARALVKNPSIIIADEPTGNLDSKNTLEVMNIIKAISKNKLVILVTHERELAEFYSSRIIEIKDGEVVNDRNVSHDEDLDYRLDNKIYLKDIKNKVLLKDKNLEINYYNDNNEKLKIDIVIKNGNIYIENKTNEKIEVLGEDSALELVDAHYEKISKKMYEEYEFDFDSLVSKNIKEKYSSIYNIFTLMKAGFKKVLNYSIIKKILLLGFMASSMFIVFAVSTILAAINVKKEDYISYNENYLIITDKKMSLENYNKYKANLGTEYVFPGDSIVNLSAKIDDYFQSSNSNATVSGSLSSIDMISKKDLILGKMPESSNEIVLDKMVVDKMIKTVEGFKFVGINSPEDFLDRIISIGNIKDYKIVGISNLSSPSIYVDRSEFITIITNSSDDPYGYDSVELEYANYELVQSKMWLKEGSWPVNDYEVVINEDNKYEYKLGSNLNKKINGIPLKVVGYYHCDTYSNTYLINENTLLYKKILESDNAFVYANDKDSALKSYRDNGVIIEDSFTESKNRYIDAIKPGVISKLIFSGIILLISVIEIFLMIRSSFLSRIKEVGILRAIGVKKLDIYKMFSGEILAITIIASTPGILLMSYILKELSSVSMLSSVIVMNLYTLVISIILVLFVNLLFGLIPVFRTIRKRPASILSRTDLE